MDLCKTRRTKKSSRDMFKFYVVLVGHDKITNAGRAPVYRRNFKARSLQTKSTKNEGPPENMGFKGIQFEDFRRKKNRNNILHLSKNPSGTPRP